MSERLRYTAKKYAILLGIGAFYLAWVLLTGLRIPCPVFYTLGLECPGCGVTRMIVAFVKLDFSASFAYNPFLFITSPVIFLCLFVSEYRYLKYGEHTLGKFRYLLWVELVFAIVFGILRNIPL